jgi:hypothetical protein
MQAVRSRCPPPVAPAPTLPLPSCAVSRPLHPAAKVMIIMTKWPPGDGPRLVYQIKLFMPSLRASNDSRIVYMLYTQGVYSVIAGLYPTTEDEAISLAALQMQAKFGSHKPGTHVTGYLQPQLRGLVPAPLYDKKSPAAWEVEILRRHAMLNEDAQKRPMQLYTAVLAAREYYGCAFFTVRQIFSKVLPEIVVIGISYGGIFLLDKENKAVMEKYSLPQILRWGFDPEAKEPLFYFGIKTAVGTAGPSFEFVTRQGEHISSLLSDYASQILREIESKHAAIKASNAATAATTAAPAAAVAPAAAAATAPVASATVSGGSAASTPARKSSAAAPPAPLPAAPGAAAFAAAASHGTPHRPTKPKRPPPTTAEAAVRVQSAFRGYNVRQTLARRYAATRLQSVVRGFLARSKFDKMIAALEDELRKQGKLK